MQTEDQVETASALRHADVDASNSKSLSTERRFCCGLDPVPAHADFRCESAAREYGGDQLRDQFVREQDRLPGAIGADNGDMDDFTAVRLASTGYVGKEWPGNLCHLGVALLVSGPELPRCNAVTSSCPARSFAR